MATKQSTKRGKAADPETAGGDRETTARGLERGDVFFFYRPDVDETSPQGLIDVRRFHVVLRPEGEAVLRLLTVGRKRLPDAANEGQRHWGFVEGVFDAPEALREALAGATYETDTLGERRVPPARPAGEGVYALVRHGRNSVLAYALELPEQPGAVQAAFGIAPRGQFVLAVKNPEAGAPAGAGLDGDRRAEFPDELMERFGSRRWVAADPPAFLNYEGAEFVLVGGRQAGDDLGLELEPEPEDIESAEVLEVLGVVDGSDRTVRPLFEGAWE